MTRGKQARLDKRKFHVGMKVCSIYESGRVFVIDKSAVPERIFHEKGSNRWWTRNELQRVGAPENPATSFRLNGKGKMRRTHSNAFPTIPGGLQVVTAASAGLEERKCLFAGCNVRFQPKRRWQKFHSEACRLAHWKLQDRPHAKVRDYDGEGQSTRRPAVAVAR